MSDMASSDLYCHCPDSISETMQICNKNNQHYSSEYKNARRPRVVKVLESSRDVIDPSLFRLLCFLTKRGPLLQSQVAINCIGGYGRYCSKARYLASRWYLKVLGICLGCLGSLR